jgi:hypothetical protein
MSDKELLEKVKAREELQNRGFTWERCLSCGGDGGMFREDYGYVMPCLACSGKGGHWKAPMTR